MTLFTPLSPFRPAAGMLLFIYLLAFLFFILKPDSWPWSSWAELVGSLMPSLVTNLRKPHFSRSDTWKNRGPDVGKSHRMWSLMIDRSWHWWMEERCWPFCKRFCLLDSHIDHQGLAQVTRPEEHRDKHSTRPFRVCSSVGCPCLPLVS